MSMITVKRGDTLWALAREHLGDPLAWKRLWVANLKIVPNPDLILPGQRLIVPRVRA